MALSISVQSVALSLIQSRMNDVRDRLQNTSSSVVNLERSNLSFFNSWIALKDNPTEEENDRAVGVNMIRTALDGLDAIAKNLQSLRRSTYQATQTSDEESWQGLIEEADIYLAEIQSIVEEVNFHGLNLFDGSRSSYGELKIYDYDTLSEVSIQLQSMQLEDLGLDGDIAIDSIDQAIHVVLPFYLSLSDSYQQFAGKYFDHQKDVVQKNVVRGISSEIDFVSNNRFHRTAQIQDGFELDILNQIDISRGRLSIRI